MGRYVHKIINGLNQLSLKKCSIPFTCLMIHSNFTMQTFKSCWCFMVCIFEWVPSSDLIMSVWNGEGGDLPFSLNRQWAEKCKWLGWGNPKVPWVDYWQILRHWGRFCCCSLWLEYEVPPATGSFVNVFGSKGFMLIREF